MGFAAMVQADIVAMTTSDEFGEELTYRPDGGAAHTVRAIVARTPLVPQEAAQKITGGRVYQITIPKDATHGRTSIAKGLDKIDVPQTRGGTPETMRIVEILAEGLGSWRVKAVS